VSVLAAALDTLGALVYALLAVVGGAVAGAVLTTFLVWLVSKLYFNRKLPHGPRRLLRWLGAVAGALLVASFIHLGIGGGGWGLGGSGFGLSGTGEPSAGKGAAADPAPPAETPAPKPDTKPPAPTADRVQVTILGGALVRGPAFYRVEGQDQAVSLQQVGDAVRRRQQAGKVAAVDILIYQNSVSSHHDAVNRLKAWVTEAGLTPNLVLLQTDIPIP
jgi:hypothetical protein